MTNTDAAKLELWHRMAQAIMRAYVKLPMTKSNEKLNAELSELGEHCRELEPELQNYFPLD